MSKELAKQMIKKAIKKIFSYEFEELMTTNNYLELLKICRQIEALPPKHSLILKAIESLFIDKGKFIEKIENDKAIQCLDYLIDKESSKKEEILKFISGHNKYQKVLKELKNATEKEKIIIEFICEIKKDIKTLIDCINIIYLNKLPNYIPSQEKYIFTGNFDDYLEQLEDHLTYNDFEKEKDYFSLEYNKEEGFHHKEYLYEEAMIIQKNMDMNKSHKDVKKYIQAHSKKTPKKDEYLNLNLQANDYESSQKQDIIKNQLDIIKGNESKIMNKNEDLRNESHQEEIIKKEIDKEYRDKFNRLEEKFEELKKDHSELKKDHSELKKDHSELKKKLEKVESELIQQKKVHEINIRKIKATHIFDINNLNNKLKQEKKNNESLLQQEKDKYTTLNENYQISKASNNELKKDKINKENKISELTEEKKVLNRKLDTIRCRALSKSIIDFLYYVFTSLFKGKNYLDEKNSIINSIIKLKDNEYKSQNIILSEFIRYLDKIYNLKLEGDDYAHPLIGIENLIGLIGYGFEHVNKILKELQLSQLFFKYNELYKKKSMEEDLNKITTEIMELLPDLRDTFFLKLKNAK